MNPATRQQQLKQGTGSLIPGCAMGNLPPKHNDLPGVIRHLPFPSTPFAIGRHLKRKPNNGVPRQYALALDQTGHPEPSCGKFSGTDSLLASLRLLRTGIRRGSALCQITSRAAQSGIIPCSAARQSLRVCPRRKGDSRRNHERAGYLISIGRVKRLECEPSGVGP
jgi:hypothetical protein